MDQQKDVELVVPAPDTQQGEIHDNVAHDEVFGEITEDGPNYRNVGWLGTSMLMMKTQIGLGVLSIPSAFNILGIIPGLICLCIMAAMCTWSGWVVGDFKKRHYQVYCIDDAVGVMLGPIVRGIYSFIFPLTWTLVCSSGMIGISTSLNALSDHGACTTVFITVAAISSFSLANIQTLGRMSWLAWVGVASLLSGILVVTIAVGVQDRPAAAPQTGAWVSDFKVVGNPTFLEAITAVSVFIFAFAGTSLFFPIAAEMRDTKLYTRSLILCQGVVTSVYIAIGCIVYYFCGSFVTSPALGSAGPTVKKVSYGLALPGLVITTTLITHISGKFIFLRIMKNSHHLIANTFTHWATWLTCNFVVALVAYVIANAVPNFGGLISLVGSLFGPLLALQPMGCMWLYDHWQMKRSIKWYAEVFWSLFLILAGTFLTVAGTYGSIISLIDASQDSTSSSWACADNSGSI